MRHCPQREDYGVNPVAGRSAPLDSEEFKREPVVCGVDSCFWRNVGKKDERARPFVSDPITASNIQHARRQSHSRGDLLG
jgi:hypothetical protein